MKTTVRAAVIGSITVAAGLLAWGALALFEKQAADQDNKRPVRASESAQAGATQAKVAGELTHVSISSTFEQGDGIVDPRSGRLFLTATDLIVPAGPVRLDVRRYFQVEPSPPGLLGARWRLNWETNLVLAGSLAMIHESVGLALFTQEEAKQEYTSQSGEKLAIQEGLAVRLKRDGTRETFDKRGRLIERSDRNGNRIALSYGENGRLARVEGPYSTFLEFQSDQDGRLTQIKSSSGSTVRYSYGRLDEQGKKLAYVGYEYGPRGELLGVDQPQSGRIAYVYDNKKRVLRRQWSDGAQEKFEYDDAAHTMRHIDPAGRATLTKWSADKRTAEITAPGGSTSTIEYDPAGQPLRITGPTGQVARFAYDALGRTTTVDSPGSGTTRFEYHGDTPFISRMTGPDGETQTWEYDSHFNLLAVASSKQDCPVAMFEYFPDGLVKAAKSCGQIHTTTKYDDKGRVWSVSDETGRTWSYEYDDQGNVVRETDPLGHATTRTYDAQGRATSVTNPAGGTTRFEYSAAGHLIKVIDPLGAETRYERDKRGRVIAMTEPGNRTTRYEFYADGKPKSVTDAAGQATRFEYDEAGNRHRAVNALRGVTTRTHDALGNVTTLRDRTGATTRFQYSPLGHLVSFTDPSGQVSQYTYDAAGRIIRNTQQGGHETRYEYTPRGHVSKIILANGLPLAYEYDDSGQLLSVTEGTQSIAKYEYDKLGRRIREKHAGGLEISYFYDALGKLLATQDNLGAKSKLEYDANRRLTSVTDSAGATTRYAYDLSGKLLSVTDALGNIKRLSYDESGFLSEVKEASGDRAKYRYDAAGRVAQVDHAGGGATAFAYNAVGELVEVIDSLGGKYESRYDSAGRLVSATDAKQQTTTFAYDSAGRIAEKRRADGYVVHYKYDARGNPTEVNDGVFPIRCTYDEYDRLAGIEYPAIKRRLSYRYDERGLRTQFTDSEGHTVHYEYDSLKRLSAIRSAESKPVRFAYDEKNRVTSVTYPNGVRGVWQYDAASRIIKLSYVDAAGKTVTSWSYKYDSAGNRIEAIDAEGRVARYRYDSVRQLVEEVTFDGKTVKYSYLPGGNRGKRESREGVIEYSYNRADQLTQAGDERFRYDANGNLIERRGPKGVTQYRYDAADRLVKVVLPNESEITFGYSPTGERIWRKDASGLTYFVTDGVNLLAELTEDLKPKASYLHSVAIDRPLMMTRAGNDYVYLADPRGSIARLTDHQGRVAAAYDYDAFGTFLSKENVPNPFKYTGREFEPGLQQYYYRARYYDPGLGRFLSRDPVPEHLLSPLTTNRYTYVRNDPINFTDPMGTTRLPDQHPVYGPYPEPSMSMERFGNSETEAKTGVGNFKPSTGVEYWGGLDDIGRASTITHERIHWVQWQEFLRNTGIVPNSPEDADRIYMRWINTGDNRNILEREAYWVEMEYLKNRGIPPSDRNFQNALSEFQRRGGDISAFRIGPTGTVTLPDAPNKVGLRNPRIVPKDPRFLAGDDDDSLQKTDRRQASPDDFETGARGKRGSLLDNIHKHGGILPHLLDAAQFAACLREKSLAECTEDLVIDEIKTTGVILIVGPNGAILIGAAGGVIEILKAGDEAITAWNDWQQRGDLAAGRNARLEFVEKRLNADIARLAAKLGPLNQLKAQIPPARAAAEMQAQNSIDLDVAAGEELVKVQNDVKLYQEVVKNLQNAAEIKTQAQTYADKASEHYELLEKGLDWADDMANSIDSDEDASKVLEAWETAQGLVREIAAKWKAARDGNEALKRIAKELVTAAEARDRASATADSIAAHAQAASDNSEPTKAKVAAAIELKNKLDGAANALRDEIEQRRAKYEETIQSLFLSDEYTEKPEVKALFTALLHRVNEAANVPPDPWPDPEKVAGPAALSAREKENIAKKLVADLKAPDISGDITAIDAAVERADEAKTLALYRLAASADLPDKVAAWNKEGIVPDVETVKAGPARDQLKGSGFNKVGFAAANAVTPKPELEGAVQRQVPVGGTKAKLRETVTLFVYPRYDETAEKPVDPLLPGDVDVPDVVGKPLREAVGLLRANKLKPEFSFPAGAPTSAAQTSALIVSKQEPAAGKHKDVASVVLVADEVIVPSVTELKKDAAEGRLNELGLRANVETIAEKPAAENQDVVKSQRPEGNARATRGSAVTLYVYPKLDDSEKSTPQTPAAAEGKWYVVREAASKQQIRLYWEVTSENSAKAVIPIPQNVQAEAQRVLGVGKEISLAAKRSGDTYLADLKPLADKIAQYLNAGFRKPRPKDEGGILFDFFGGSGGEPVQLEIGFPRIGAEITPDGANLRIRIKGNYVQITNGKKDDVPFDFQFIGTPE